MRNILGRRPSPALIVACLALAVALSGTGYAAITLPQNSVGTRQVINHSLRRVDFNQGTLLRGPAGTIGRTSEPSSSVSFPATTGTDVNVSVQCLPRTVRLGGGFDTTLEFPTAVSLPTVRYSRPVLRGWSAGARSNGAAGTLTAYAVCGRR